MYPDERIYTSNLSRKGALVDESLIVLARINAGESLESIRQEVLEEDLLQKTTRATRHGVWKEIRSRYLNDDEIAPPLARFVAHNQNPTTIRLALLFEFCQSDHLLRDTILGCIYPRYEGGFSGVGKGEIQAFFDQLAPEHPEVTTWSPQTRDKVVSNILSILRDFGLLEGTQRKQFARLYIPIEAFVYALYRQRDRGAVTAPEVVESDDWRLFLLDRNDVLALLTEASSAGHVVFKHQADVMDLAWTYPTLEACVEALVGKV
jgi:hypothetical protein